MYIFLACEQFLNLWNKLWKWELFSTAEHVLKTWIFLKFWFFSNKNIFLKLWKKLRTRICFEISKTKKIKTRTIFNMWKTQTYFRTQTFFGTMNKFWKAHVNTLEIRRPPSASAKRSSVEGSHRKPASECWSILWQLDRLISSTGRKKHSLCMGLLGRRRKRPVKIYWVDLLLWFCSFALVFDY